MGPKAVSRNLKRRPGMVITIMLMSIVSITPYIYHRLAEGEDTLSPFDDTNDLERLHEAQGKVLWDEATRSPGLSSYSAKDRGLEPTASTDSGDREGDASVPSLGETEQDDSSDATGALTPMPGVNQAGSQTGIGESVQFTDTADVRGFVHSGLQGNMPQQQQQQQQQQSSQGIPSELMPQGHAPAQGLRLPEDTASSSLPFPNSITTRDAGSTRDPGLVPPAGGATHASGATGAQGAEAKLSGSQPQASAPMGDARPGSLQSASGSSARGGTLPPQQQQQGVASSHGSQPSASSTRTSGDGGGGGGGGVSFSTASVSSTHGAFSSVPPHGTGGHATGTANVPHAASPHVGTFGRNGTHAVKTDSGVHATAHAPTPMLASSTSSQPPPLAKGERERAPLASSPVHADKHAHGGDGAKGQHHRGETTGSLAHTSGGKKAGSKLVSAEGEGILHKGVDGTHGKGGHGGGGGSSVAAATGHGHATGHTASNSVGSGKSGGSTSGHGHVGEGAQGDANYSPKDASRERGHVAGSGGKGGSSGGMGGSGSTTGGNGGIRRASPGAGLNAGAAHGSGGQGGSGGGQHLEGGHVGGINGEGNREGAHGGMSGSSNSNSINDHADSNSKGNGGVGVITAPAPAPFDQYHNPAHIARLAAQVLELMKGGSGDDDDDGALVHERPHRMSVGMFRGGDRHNEVELTEVIAERVAQGVDLKLSANGQMKAREASFLDLVTSAGGSTSHGGGGSGLGGPINGGGEGGGEGGRMLYLPKGTNLKLTGDGKLPVEEQSRRAGPLLLNLPPGTNLKLTSDGKLPSAIRETHGQGVRLESLKVPLGTNLKLTSDGKLPAVFGAGHGQPGSLQALLVPLGTNLKLTSDGKLPSAFSNAHGQVPIQVPLGTDLRLSADGTLPSASSSGAAPASVRDSGHHGGGDGAAGVLVGQGGAEGGSHGGASVGGVGETRGFGGGGAGASSSGAGSLLVVPAGVNLKLSADGKLEPFSSGHQSSSASGIGSSNGGSGDPGKNNAGGGEGGGDQGGVLRVTDDSRVVGGADRWKAAALAEAERKRAVSLLPSSGTVAVAHSDPLLDKALSSWHAAHDPGNGQILGELEAISGDKVSLSPSSRPSSLAASSSPALSASSSRALSGSSSGTDVNSGAHGVQGGAHPSPSSSSSSGSASSLSSASSVPSAGIPSASSSSHSPNAHADDDRGARGVQGGSPGGGGATGGGTEGGGGGAGDRHKSGAGVNTHAEAHAKGPAAVGHSLTSGHGHSEHASLPSKSGSSAGMHLDGKPMGSDGSSSSKAASFDKAALSTSGASKANVLAAAGAHREGAGGGGGQQGRRGLAHEHALTAGSDLVAAVTVTKQAAGASTGGSLMVGVMARDHNMDGGETHRTGFDRPGAPPLEGDASFVAKSKVKPWGWHALDAVLPETLQLEEHAVGGDVRITDEQRPLGDARIMDPGAARPLGVARVTDGERSSLAHSGAGVDAAMTNHDRSPAHLPDSAKGGEGPHQGAHGASRDGAGSDGENSATSAAWKAGAAAFQWGAAYTAGADEDGFSGLNAGDGGSPGVNGDARVEDAGRGGAGAGHGDVGGREIGGGVVAGDGSGETLEGHASLGTMGAGDGGGDGMASENAGVFGAAVNIINDHNKGEGGSAGDDESVRMAAEMRRIVQAQGGVLAPGSQLLKDLKGDLLQGRWVSGAPLVTGGGSDSRGVNRSKAPGSAGPRSGSSSATSGGSKDTRGVTSSRSSSGGTHGALRRGGGVSGPNGGNGGGEGIGNGRRGVRKRGGNSRGGRPGGVLAAGRPGQGGVKRVSRGSAGS
eukprot:jgi/Mesvir1/7827/Mv11768-RA.1